MSVRLYYLELLNSGRLNLSHYSKLTPAIDLGKKRPKKKALQKQLEICREFNGPVRNRLNPGFATVYQKEFLVAFRKICRIFADSNFVRPDRQVLILMLENEIYPCRADQFNETIVRRLAGDIFD